MRHAALIALLACAASATAAAGGCPRGWEPVPRAEAESVAELGLNRFKYVAHDEVCTDYPIYIESGGVREWGIGALTPPPPALPPLAPAVPAAPSRRVLAFWLQAQVLILVAALPPCRRHAALHGWRGLFPV